MKWKKYMRHKKANREGEKDDASAIHLSQLEIFCIAICVSEAEEKFMLTYSLSICAFFRFSLLMSAFKNSAWGVL